MFLKNKRNQQGFTLMELMVTVAVIGILASLAIPAYSEYVKKSKRSEAKVSLMEIAQKQESYFVQNMSYAQNLTAMGYATNIISSENDNYSLEITATPANCNTAGNLACNEYTVIATPTSASQLKDHDCIKLSLTNTGKRGAFIGTTTSSTPATPAQMKNCWSK